MPQRWFIRNTSTDLLTGRNPRLRGYQSPAGHVPEIIGHVPEFGGHAAETVGHDGPKYALRLGPQFDLDCMYSHQSSRRCRCRVVLSSLQQILSADSHPTKESRGQRNPSLGAHQNRIQHECRSPRGSARLAPTDIKRSEVAGVMPRPGGYRTTGPVQCPDCARQTSLLFWNSSPLSALSSRTFSCREAMTNSWQRGPT